MPGVSGSHMGQAGLGNERTATVTLTLLFFFFFSVTLEPAQDG